MHKTFRMPTLIIWKLYSALNNSGSVTYTYYPQGAPGALSISQLSISWDFECISIDTVNQKLEPGKAWEWGYHSHPAQLHIFTPRAPHHKKYQGLEMRLYITNTHIVCSKACDQMCFKKPTIKAWKLEKMSATRIHIVLSTSSFICIKSLCQYWKSYHDSRDRLT